jgi:hypothetical protein
MRHPGGGESEKNPVPLAGTEHNGFGSVDALREDIEGRDTRARLVGQPRRRPLSLPGNTRGTIESFIPRGVWLCREAGHKANHVACLRPASMWGTISVAGSFTAIASTQRPTLLTS